jgi:hypothetical protein
MNAVDSRTLPHPGRISQYLGASALSRCASETFLRSRLSQVRGNVSVSGKALDGSSAGLASLCGVLHLLPLLKDLDLRDNFVGRAVRTTLAAAAQTTQRIKLLM